MPFILSDEQVKTLLDHFYIDGPPFLPYELREVVSGLVDKWNQAHPLPKQSEPQPVPFSPVYEYEYGMVSIETQDLPTHALRRQGSSQELHRLVNRPFHQGVTTDMRLSVDIDCSKQSPRFPSNFTNEIPLPSPTLCALSPQETAQMRFDVGEMTVPLKSSKSPVECLSSPYSTASMNLSEASLGRDGRLKNGKKRPPTTKKCPLADETLSRNARTTRSENCRERRTQAIAPYPPRPAHDYRSEPLIPRLEETEGSTAEIRITGNAYNSLFEQTGDVNGVDSSSFTDLSTFICSKEGTDVLATAMTKYYTPQHSSWNGDRFQSYDQPAASNTLGFGDEQNVTGLGPLG